jgi:hypothetical protein
MDITQSQGKYAVMLKYLSWLPSLAENWATRSLFWLLDLCALNQISDSGRNWFEGKSKQIPVLGTRWWWWPEYQKLNASAASPTHPFASFQSVSVPTSHGHQQPWTCGSEHCPLWPIPESCRSRGRHPWPAPQTGSIDTTRIAPYRIFSAGLPESFWWIIIKSHFFRSVLRATASLKQMVERLLVCHYSLGCQLYLQKLAEAFSSPHPRPEKHRKPRDLHERVCGINEEV